MTAPMTPPDLAALNHDNIVAFIGDIFERRGNEEYLGEPVTIAAHMLRIRRRHRRAHAAHPAPSRR